MLAHSIGVTSIIYFLGTNGLASATRGEKLLTVIQTLSRADVSAPSDTADEGRQAIKSYFNLEKYDEWVKMKTVMLRSGPQRAGSNSSIKGFSR
jgi:hypothetical protein